MGKVSDGDDNEGSGTAKSCNLSEMAGLTGLVNQISGIFKIVRKWRNVDLTIRFS